MSDENPTGSRGVAYLRISSDKQDADSQRKSIEGWLHRRNLAVERWFEDVGARDLAGKRKDFQKLLKAVTAGQIDWIVVDAKDRFGTRSGYEFGEFANLLQNNDVHLWSVTQGCLTADDASTEILNAVDSVRSRDEQKARGQRSLRGKIAAVKRGEWQGGYPPFGYDVACVGPDGREKWRVFYTAAQQRLKIYPRKDRRPSEPYDGKGNMPSHDKGDVLRLVPSCDKKRVEIARNIFRWFATESISLRGVCTRLNDLKISPVVGDGWYSSRLGPMLRNPAYVTGAGCWNKNAHGRFFEFAGGAYQEVARTKGKAKAGRKRSAEDFVQADATDEVGIIDRATWEAVQLKLKDLHSLNKSPRNPDLWLAGLLFCGHCRRRMAGWFLKSDKYAPISYTCSTYRQFGTANPSNCRLHRTSGKLIERLIEEYLNQSGQALELLTADRGEEFIGELEIEIERHQEGFMRHFCRLWREVRESGARSPEGQPWTAKNLCDAFGAKVSTQRAELEERLVAKEKELERTVRKFAGLTNKAATAAANKVIDELGAEIEELKAALAPRDTELLTKRAELVRLRDEVAAARRACAGDANRQKADALGRVVERIICRFQHSQAGTQKRSVLSEVTFVPFEGEEATILVGADLRSGISPGRD
jgi:DNA invertase Pin-like site-specific DNA recombinase